MISKLGLQDWASYRYLVKRRIVIHSDGYPSLYMFPGDRLEFSYTKMIDDVVGTVYEVFSAQNRLKKGLVALTKNELERYVAAKSLKVL